jgi:hypothetical protein
MHKKYVNESISGVVRFNARKSGEKTTCCDQQHQKETSKETPKAEDAQFYKRGNAAEAELGYRVKVSLGVGGLCHGQWSVTG